MIYERYFGLTYHPFSVSPDPRFLYSSDCHREALASLKYGIIERRGLMSLVGEVGTGKSTLIRALLEEIDVSTRTVLITHTTIDRDELLWLILDELQLDTSGSRVELLRALREFVVNEWQLGRPAPVLIVDEAHNLSDDVLEEIRLLTNLEQAEGKLIQVVLSGQPELELKLAQPNLRQLNQRIAIRARLEPLSEKEMARYIQHRLTVAGCEDPNLFDGSAIKVIWQASHGTPREINNLCDQSLINAYGAGRRHVDAASAREASADLELSSGVSHRMPHPGADPVEDDETDLAAVEAVSVAHGVHARPEADRADPPPAPRAKRRHGDRPPKKRRRTTAALRESRPLVERLGLVKVRSAVAALAGSIDVRWRLAAVVVSGIVVVLLILPIFFDSAVNSNQPLSRRVDDNAANDAPAPAPAQPDPVAARPTPPASNPVQSAPRTVTAPTADVALQVEPQTVAGDGPQTTPAPQTTTTSPQQTTNPPAGPVATLTDPPAAVTNPAPDDTAAAIDEGTPTGETMPLETDNPLAGETQLPAPAATGPEATDRAATSPVRSLVGPAKRPTGPDAESGAFEEPVVIRRVEPIYPPEASTLGIEGDVLIHVVVDETGRVAMKMLFQRDHPLLNKAALDAVSQWEFRPALLNGQAAAVWVPIQVQFDLP